jgi:small subunit ribosomal protein S4
MKLFLKGDRCYMAKCPIETGRPVPGMHGGGRRRGKQSDYGTQLREKQRLRRMYGLREGQFRLFFDRAARKTGLTGENLLQMLETRLDNMVYRLGFAPSRRAARLYVQHGHVRVDGKKANIPSMTVSAGQVIEVRNKPGSRAYASRSLEAAEGRPLSPWLSMDKDKLSGELLHVPSREEISPIVNEQLIVELYSK